MKKLLFSILLIPFLLHAGNVPESVTSGSVGLVKPSTTTPDASRNYGAKINSNFDVIAATFGTAFANFNNFTSTTQAAINLFNSYMGTNTVQLNQAGVATTTLRTEINTSTNALASTLAIRTVTLADEGTALAGGALTQINCVGTAIACTQSNGTGTVTITASNATVGNSTYTKSLVADKYILNSTNGVTSLAYFSSGHSTLNVVGISVFSPKPSTVTITSFYLALSTGINGLPATIFSPRLDISTKSSGNTDFANYYTTGFLIPPNTWAGLQSTSPAISGTPTYGVQVDIDLWQVPYPR